MNKKYLLSSATLGLLILVKAPIGHASQNPSYQFSLANYDQQISDWINPDVAAAFYDKPLLSENIQKIRMALFYSHYFGASSPWDVNYIKQIFSASTKNLQTIEQEILYNFSNYVYEYDPQTKTYINKGLKPEERQGRNTCSEQAYSDNWIKKLTEAVNFPQFAGQSYQPLLRGIAIDNLNARLLPTDDAYFLKCTLPGEGPPFDYLQMSAIWAGTPVYILGEAKFRDRTWYLIASPDFIAWVHSNGIAKVSNKFVKDWQDAAYQGFVAINSPINSKQLLIMDQDTGKLGFLGYLGAVFPLASATTSGINVLIPSVDVNQQAQIHHAFLSHQDAVLMPLTATPRHFSEVISHLIGRPYGWGNIGFNNDCSAELKSLYAPFGIWLPRHSSEQMTVGKMLDLSPQSPDGRLNAITGNGHSFMTIVYITGHVFMYLGNYANPYGSAHTLMPLIYQNRWGMRRKTGSDMRAVIGKAVLFPLLKTYPEDQNLISALEDKYFKVTYLDELPADSLSQLGIANVKAIDLNSLMLPESLINSP